MTTTAPAAVEAATPRRAATAWPPYGAAAAALLFAAASLYWALGGTVGLGTLGGRLEDMARARNPLIVSLLWAAVVLKALGGLLALALVQPWGRALPRRLLLSVAWIGATVLILYGGVQVIVEALVELGVLNPVGPVDWTALRWHLAVWDLWFLLWGLLLAAAARQHNRGPRPR